MRMIDIKKKYFRKDAVMQRKDRFSEITEKRGRDFIKSGL